MRVFINALAASAGGGLTYIRNVIPELAARPGLQVTVALAPGGRKELQGSANIDFVELELPAARRFWYEQSVLPGVIHRSGADCVLSAGNFAIRKSPVPQILLSRNSLYTSTDFYHDLLSRHEYKAWATTRLQGLFARKSVAWADVTVAPSEGFAEELRRWTRGTQIRTIHHGFDREVFTRDASPLNPILQDALRAAEGSVKLLFVSHYNYYRNFETLLRALPVLRERMHDRKIKLLLTCRLAAGANPGAYRPDSASELVRELRINDMVVELGEIPYRQLHQVYRIANLYVSPAYAESFAHPLVEAMSSGVPVVASDLPVHREICGKAAVYFPRFSPSELAERLSEVMLSSDRASEMKQEGLKRSEDFSWKKHVDELLVLMGSLVSQNVRDAPGC